jgi:hypothetical protein
MIHTEREFSKMCISRGFARLAPRFYARCIGDGIYQTICTGFRKYIHTDSPNYSSQDRKSYYISIGLHSIYSCHCEDAFIPGKAPGGYRPADLKAKEKYKGIFNGIEEEYRIMEEVGFDVLDTINTQEAFLDWWAKVEVLSSGMRIHDIRLVEPFLLCGQVYEAEIEISTSFIHGISAYRSYQKRIEQGLDEHYPPYEQRIQESAEKELTLWHWCMSKKYDEMSQYISDNYQRNCTWIKKYGIPVIQHSQQRSMPNFIVTNR